MDIRNELKEWTDLDITLHLIASKLGIVHENTFAENKYLYWTENKYNEFLQETLQKMIELKVLEINREENTIRYNKNFTI